MSLAGCVSCTWESTGAYRMLVERPDNLEDTGINGGIILRWFFMKWDGDMDWIYLAHGMEKRWTLVNAVLNLRVP